MTEQEIFDHIYRNQSYLKKGDDFLSNKFQIDKNVINRIKMKVKDSNKQICNSYNLDPQKWQVSQIWKGPKGDSVQFKPKPDQTDFLEEYKEFIKNFNLGEVNISFLTDREMTKEKDLYMVFCLFDAHLGRFALSKYTNTDTNLDIQEKDLNAIVQEVFNDCPFERVKEIIIPIGNDFFNVDNSFYQTSNGTPQKNVPDLHGMFSLGLTFLTELSISLSVVAPVKLILIPGNHDSMSSTYLAVALEHIFTDSEFVSVDSSPIERKCLKLGKTLLGLAHGELKPEKYADLLPFEGKEYFSDCDFFEYLLGDKHHEKFFQREINGVTVRHLSGLTRKDIWTYEEGYTTSIRRAYSIFYHEKEGRYLERIHQML